MPGAQPGPGREESSMSSSASSTLSPFGGGGKVLEHSPPGSSAPRSAHPLGSFTSGVQSGEIRLCKGKQLAVEFWPSSLTPVWFTLKTNYPTAKEAWAAPAIWGTGFLPVVKCAQHPLPAHLAQL